MRGAPIVTATGPRGAAAGYSPSYLLESDNQNVVGLLHCAGEGKAAGRTGSCKNGRKYEQLLSSLLRVRAPHLSSQADGIQSSPERSGRENRNIDVS